MFIIVIVYFMFVLLNIVFSGVGRIDKFILCFLLKVMLSIRYVEINGNLCILYFYCGEMDCFIYVGVLESFVWCSLFLGFW